MDCTASCEAQETPHACVQDADVCERRCNVCLLCDSMTGHEMKRHFLEYHCATAPPVREDPLSEAKNEEEAEEQPPAGRLPTELLQRIFGYLYPTDIACAGQVCSQWRQAAKDQRVWQSASLDYHSPPTALRRRGCTSKYHPFPREFCRVLRFSPAFKRLAIVGPVKPRVRKEILSSSFTVREAVLNSSKAWTKAFLSKHREELQCVELWLCSHYGAQVAAGLPHLKRLALCYPKETFTTAFSTVEPHVFVEPELPDLRHLQLLRAPLESVRSLLLLRGATLDTLDTDAVTMTLELLPSLKLLESLVLRSDCWRYRLVELKRGLLAALPSLHWLQELVLLNCEAKAPCCSLFLRRWCVHHVCDCAFLERAMATLRLNVLQVECLSCRPAGLASALAEVDMDRFVYKGPNRHRRCL